MLTNHKFTLYVYIGWAKKKKTPKNKKTKNRTHTFLTEIHKWNSSLFFFFRIWSRFCTWKIGTIVFTNMSWSTKEKTFCVEVYFANKSYTVVHANFRREFRCQNAPSKAEFLTGLRNLESMVLFTQPLRSGRIWHKVNFLSGV